MTGRNEFLFRKQDNNVGLQIGDEFTCDCVNGYIHFGCFVASKEVQDRISRMSLDDNLKYDYRNTNELRRQTQPKHKVYCPYCGSRELDIKNEPVFGAGISTIEIARCLNCDEKF